MQKILFIAILTITLYGCNTINPNDRTVPVAKKMAAAENFFEKGKYRKAAELYESVVFEKSAGFTAKAQMRLADCYFNRKQWMEARIEYDEMIKLFPDYDSIDKAYYNIGLCYFNESLAPQYTQEETIEAAEAFERFIDMFPGHEKQNKAIEYIRKCHKKLIHKKYYNGYIYFKMKDYSSAELYLKEVVEAKVHDEFEEKSLYYLAEIYKFWEEEFLFENVVNNLKDFFPDSEYLDKIEE